MHIKNIKPLIGFGTYQTHTSLSSLDRVIMNYIEEDGLILNPDFQRGHVWTEDQQIAYVEFKLKKGKDPSPILFNHPAWMTT